MRLIFQSGTINLEDFSPDGLPLELVKWFKADPRTRTLRARACDYAEIVICLRKNRITFEDCVRDFAPLPDLELQEKIVLRPHQQRALDAWLQNECRGIAALPTGSGKTILAVHAIAKLKRPAFIMVPTIDLMIRYIEKVCRSFGQV